MADNEYTQAVDQIPDDTFLTVTRTAANYLVETSKWAFFLSIMGFIFSGLIVIAGIFAGSILGAMTQGQLPGLPQGLGALLGVIYVLLGIVYFIPSWYLFKFAQRLKSALSKRDRQELDESFANQKSLYKFWGIFTIVIFGIYAIMFVFGVMASMTR